jgi:hypothetical protein
MANRKVGRRTSLCDLQTFYKVSISKIALKPE